MSKRKLICIFLSFVMCASLFCVFACQHTVPGFRTEF